MNRNKYCIIMAGGTGTRFWPRSRQALPKQFIDILGSGKSPIRETYERFLQIVPNENFIVVTNRRYRDIVLEHIPELSADQILCEPIQRNTATGICYAAFSLLKRNPEAEMIITPSDHHIDDLDQFRLIIEDCANFASENSALVTVGVLPTRAETGYGYLQVSDSNPVSRVKCFTEKPILEMAQTFVECGEFYWNTGIFIWKVKDIVEAIERYLPEHYALFSSVIDKLGGEDEGRAMSRIFSECRSISIEYGVMERAENVYVRTGEFGWSEVGVWGSVYQLSSKDKCANVCSDKVILHNTHNSLISLPKDKLAVINGLNDYIVIDTPDVLMICPRSEEQSIKGYIDDAKYNEGDKYI